jgi:hypothetical protein
MPCPPRRGRLVAPISIVAEIRVALREGGADSGVVEVAEQRDDPATGAPRRRCEQQVRAVDTALAEDLPAFNALVRNADVPAVVVAEGK